MLLAAQNKYWGTVEEATRFWLDFGVDHLMVKRYKNLKWIDQNGRIIEKDFEKLSKLQEEYGVKYHLHLYNLVLNEIYITSSVKKAQPVLNRILADLDKKIREYNLYPLIVIHLPRLDHPEYHFDLSEEAALENSTDFFQNLNLKSKLALETMHDPYRNPGHALLGYKADHFRELIGDKNFGLCIDTGHTKMTEEPLEKFLEVSYPIYSCHLNGNDGTRDQHQLPTRENVGNFEKVVEVLKRCEGPVVLEVVDHNYSKTEIKECIHFWKNLLEGN